MKYEVVENATGARMSHQRGKGELMGSTLFDSTNEASAWMLANEVSMKTHRVEVAK